jgi:predicted TPR repeat methyltransferase
LDSVTQDLLQIALEHHRAGRLRQAEEGYRALIAQDPNHADALHWLGVLLCQAGQGEAAIALLERAVVRRPDDAAFQHNLGQAYTIARRPADAIEAFARAAELEPGRAETLHQLALAYLTRREDGDADVAVGALRRAHATGLDTPQLHHDHGVALLHAGRADEAIAAFTVALSKDRDYASAYHHMAFAHRAKGDAKQVRNCLIKALEIDPALAQGWYALGVLDMEAGQAGQALGSLRRAVRLKPDYAAAYEALGRVLEQEGKPAEALKALELAQRIAHPRPSMAAKKAAVKQTSVADLERRITPDESTERLHYLLASATNLLTPSHVPPEQVAALFDRYAEGFDEHLQGKLAYQVPPLLAAAVAKHKPDRLMDAFDLGCGTGLCGPLLRPMCATLRGVDLSPAMIEKAKARGVYDLLEVGDLVEALRHSPQKFDLLTAADVLNYLGDLAPVLEAAAASLRPTGLMIFTVEAAGGDRFHLQRHIHRYAHSEPYLRHVATIYGFEVRSIEPITSRLEAETPVAGFLVVLELPALNASSDPTAAGRG